MAWPKQMKTLTQWRVERGLTVQAMAELLGKSGGSLEKYLSGERVPSVVKAYRIAAALGIGVPQELERKTALSGFWRCAH